MDRNGETMQQVCVKSLLVSDETIPESDLSGLISHFLNKAAFAVEKPQPVIVSGLQNAIPGSEWRLLRCYCLVACAPDQIIEYNCSQRPIAHRRQDLNIPVRVRAASDRQTASRGIDYELLNLSHVVGFNEIAVSLCFAGCGQFGYASGFDVTGCGRDPALFRLPEARRQFNHRETPAGDQILQHLTGADRRQLMHIA